MPLGSIYDTGTVAVTNGSATVVGTGVFWSDVLMGDHLVIAGLISLIDSVDTGANTITLMKPYGGASNGAATYQIAKMSWLRYDPSIVMMQVRDLLSKMSDSNTALIYYTVGTPDPAIGDNGDLAIDVTPQPWHFWLKVSGAWVAQLTAFGINGRFRVATDPFEFYVNPTSGSDSNNGTAAGSPFLTAAKACSVIQKDYDFAGSTVIVNLQAGTYNESLIDLPGLPHAQPLIGSGTIWSGCVLRGNPTTPSSVIINGQIRCRGTGSFWYVTGMKLQGTAQFSLYANNAGRMRVGKVELSTKTGAGIGTGTAHICAERSGDLEMFEPYTITGGGPAHHALARYGGMIRANQAPVTLSGTPAFTGSFVRSEFGGGIDWVAGAGTPFTGSASAGTPRHFVANNSWISTNGGASGSGNATTYFPGGTAGTVTAASYGSLT